MAQVRLGSGLGRIRVPKPRNKGAKAPEEFCGGKRVFLTWSRRVPVLCPILSTGKEYSCSRDTCMVCTYEYVDVLTHVRIMVE